MSQTDIKNGADLLVDQLHKNGVSTIFCITGAGNLAIVDAINKSGNFEVVYSHHEQAAVMEAQGYSRVTGEVGVALVTTGGGTVNALTGILSAYLDSVPLLVISGNESSFHCENMSNFRAYGVQGFDSQRVAEPMTKLSQRILRSEEIIDKFNYAWNTAKSNRKGPTLLDFPMDLQRIPSAIGINESKSITIPARRSEPRTGSVEDDISECTRRLLDAERPLIYFGNGIRDPDTQKLARKVVEKYQLPFCLSWSALDLFEDKHPLNMGRIGIYGDRAANIILQKSDFLLCVGTRLAIPQVGYDKADFGRMAEKWVIDIDEIELSKFDGMGWHLLCISAETFLDQLAQKFDLAVPYPSTIDWLKNIGEVWKALPRINQVGVLDVGPQEVHSASVIEYLNSTLNDDAIVVTDVGAGLLTGHYMVEPRGSQRIFTSQGLGEMGFGLPGAIGAFFANRNRQLICLNTDGAIMFNMQELQVVKEHSIPLKLIVFNNNGYSMIKISQENLFNSRFAGSGVESGVSFPNFADLAHTFGMEHCLIDEPSKLDSKLNRLLLSPAAILIEIKMSANQKYFPRLATSKLLDGSLISPPLEDLDPKISIELLEMYLGYQPHVNSYRARGIEFEPNQN
jgi:acetolactate synthase I/II/III large subunit